MIRELQEEDIPQWVELVKQLSPRAGIGNISPEDVICELTDGGTKYIMVYEQDGVVIGTTSILFEYKVNAGTTRCKTTELMFCVGHIEEVIVDRNHRGSGIGKLLMDEAVRICKENDCYKIVLDCSEDNIPFYEKCGFHKHEVCMRLDI